MEQTTAIGQTAAVLFLPPDTTYAEAEPRASIAGLLPWRMAVMLCCPYCHADLEVRGEVANDIGIERGTLACESRACGASFPIRSGIPDMMPEQQLLGDGWRQWDAHLDQFRRRRTLRVDDAARLASRIHVKKRGLQRAFARFTAITHGVVLDVGCGPGKLRFHFDPTHVDYYGIDPMPMPEATEFPYARALAEFIPFKDGMFTDVVVVSALDHFRDCSVFFAEVSRVLEPSGKLHVVQSVHDVTRPIKLATHWFKDALEDRATRGHGTSAPHHMHEFTRRSFLERVTPYFTVLDEARYSSNWYSPDKLFLTLVRR